MRPFGPASQIAMALVLLAPMVCHRVSAADDAAERELEPSLVVAAYRLEIEAVRLLVASGVDVNAELGEHERGLLRDGWGGGGWVASEDFTPLLAAARASEVPPPDFDVEGIGVLALRQMKHEVPDEKIDERQRLRLDVMKFLLDAGANVDHADSRGGTALSHSVYRREEEVVALLLDHNANVNTQTGIYIDGTDGIAPIHRAVGHLPILERLLEVKPDLDVRDSEGETALHWAVRDGMSFFLRTVRHDNGVEAVRLLLESGAHPAIESEAGLTPADWIARFDSHGIGCLIDHSGRISRVRPRGVEDDDQQETWRLRRSAAEEEMRRLLRSAAESRGILAGRIDDYTRWLGGQGLLSVTGGSRRSTSSDEDDEDGTLPDIHLQVARIEDIDLMEYRLVLTLQEGSFDYVAPGDIDADPRDFVLFATTDVRDTDCGYVRVQITDGVLEGAAVNVRCPLSEREGESGLATRSAAVFVIPESLKVSAQANVPFEIDATI